MNKCFQNKVTSYTNNSNSTLDTLWLITLKWILSKAVLY